MRHAFWCDVCLATTYFLERGCDVKFSYLIKSQCNFFVQLWLNKVSQRKLGKIVQAKRIRFILFLARRVTERQRCVRQNTQGNSKLGKIQIYLKRFTFRYNLMKINFFSRWERTVAVHFTRKYINGTENSRDGCSGGVQGVRTSTPWDEKKKHETRLKSFLIVSPPPKKNPWSAPEQVTGLSSQVCHTFLRAVWSDGVLPCVADTDISSVTCVLHQP